MKESYFIRVTRQTPTKFWINNPSREQASLAIAHGAAGCTCNPSYTQKMVDSPEEENTLCTFWMSPFRRPNVINTPPRSSSASSSLPSPNASCRFLQIPLGLMGTSVSRRTPSMMKTRKKSCARRVTTGGSAKIFAVRYRPRPLAWKRWRR